jgi:uncharacterized RDD family membrane protein YckC
MSQIKIPTSFNIELSFELAPFHKRLFAWIIDVVIILGYYYLVFELMALYEAKQQANKTADELHSSYNISYMWIIVSAPILLYHLICEISLNGQSIGKKLMHIRVISDNGGRPGIDQYLLRWLLRTVDFSITFFLGGLISSLVTKHQQRLGDLAAGTIVIDTKIQANIYDTVFEHIDSSYQPVYTRQQVMRLSDRDMNIIKGITANASRSGSYDTAINVSEKIRNALNITEYQEPFDFLQTLLNDYNYYANHK